MQQLTDDMAPISVDLETDDGFWQVTIGGPESSIRRTVEMVIGSGFTEGGLLPAPASLGAEGRVKLLRVESCAVGERAVFIVRHPDDVLGEAQVVTGQVRRISR